MALKPFASVPKTEREWQAWLAQSSDLRVRYGTGDPEGVVIADRGTLFMRTDGSTSTTLYVKCADDGEATGWVGK